MEESGQKVQASSEKTELGCEVRVDRSHHGRVMHRVTGSSSEGMGSPGDLFQMMDAHYIDSGDHFKTSVSQVIVLHVLNKTGTKFLEWTGFSSHHNNAAGIVHLPDR